ncbi:hypothetical protein CU669_08950 [Paramagnetospirillum kuznetsovii]|uniref:Uncharacterized protein n=1 Tax=Paramagnetospirillum kuznetsovii TaxID=2053833 RepID=A0A364NYT4_9PROT|nr:hypothetical protein [Paramagnetospirillum kuznetsovii]RAU22244.1 hypothetical protein CU669_08950 [Paramagnetospirillum kuznetsovii]
MVHLETLLRAAVAEHDNQDLLARTRVKWDVTESRQRQMGAFLEKQGLGKAFVQWEADVHAVENLRRGHGDSWVAYEKSLADCAADLRRYGTNKAVMVGRGQRHLLRLFDVGAQALGHQSRLINPRRFVTEGGALGSAWTVVSRCSSFIAPQSAG